MGSPPGFRNGLPPEKRRTVSNSEPLEPRKRPRTESTAPASLHKYHPEENYCDDYRLLFNEVVQQVATRFVSDVASRSHCAWQIGASLWSPDEQTTFYAALERLGKDNVPDIADAIGTKSIPETRALLLLLEDAAAKQGDAEVTLRDIPGALDVSDKCNEQLDFAAEALARNQEKWEARQEQKQFGDYWLITPTVAQEIEAAINFNNRPNATTPMEGEVKSQKRGGKVVPGACLSCRKLKERCDRKTPCGNCQKRNKGLCKYPNLPTRTTQTEILKEPNESQKAENNFGILEALPEATLLRPQVMLELSKNVFMNRSSTLPSPWPHWSEYTSDIAQEPSIYRTTFGDFHNLVVSLTRRLVQTAIIQAIMRLRSRVRHNPNPASAVVRSCDVRAALDILGMQRNGKQRWSGVARRCALRVYDYEASSDGKKISRREMPWDEVERTLTLAGPAADISTMNVETPGDCIKPRSRASRSGTPLPLEDLALSDSDESMLDEVAPTSQPRPQPQDLAGEYARPSLSEDDELLAPELVSLEQFDREASRREEEKLWTMLDLEPPEDDGDKDDDNEGSLSQDEKIITLPNGWRSWTDYHAEWEEFGTLPSPAQFMANQKPLAVPPVLHTTEREDSGSDDSESPQPTKPPQKKPVISELQTLSGRAYADRQIRALIERESSSASDSEEEDMSDGDSDDKDTSDGHSDDEDTSGGDGDDETTSDGYSDDEGMNRPMQSVDTDGRSSPLGVSEDGDINMASESTVPINSRRKTRLPAHSDDELSEMDWNSFIE